MLARTTFQRFCALHLLLWTAVNGASAQPTKAGNLCQLEGELLTPSAWCESNRLVPNFSELLTPADWSKQPTILEPYEPEPEPEPDLLTPLEWASSEGAGLHVR